MLWGEYVDSTSMILSSEFRFSINKLCYLGKITESLEYTFFQKKKKKMREFDQIIFTVL